MPVKPGRPRREDIEAVGGHVPEPELVYGMHLVHILFRIGPAKSDGPITEADIEVYERRRGINLEPWQADAVIAMSKGYLGETHAAQKNDAPPPWPEAVKMWHYVCNARAEQSWDNFEKDTRHGSS